MRRGEGKEEEEGGRERNKGEVKVGRTSSDQRHKHLWARKLVLEGVVDLPTSTPNHTDWLISSPLNLEEEEQRGKAHRNSLLLRDPSLLLGELLRLLVLLLSKLLSLLQLLLRLLSLGYNDLLSFSSLLSSILLGLLVLSLDLSFDLLLSFGSSEGGVSFDGFGGFEVGGGLKTGAREREGGREGWKGEGRTGRKMEEGREKGG